MSILIVTLLIASLGNAESEEHVGSDNELHVSDYLQNILNNIHQQYGDIHIYTLYHMTSTGKLQEAISISIIQ
ncbi:hypothetical protein KSF78_0008432 [Schistosoma japonicum]|nr:hypothetical protein KSF78_0008432 [Schistosoma japonicum]